MNISKKRYKRITLSLLDLTILQFMVTLLFTNQLQAMGDKIESKHIAYEAKVNVISGSDDVHLFPHLPKGNVESAEVAIEVAKKIKYPVMVKGKQVYSPKTLFSCKRRWW
jgi:hypothetical protein